MGNGTFKYFGLQEQILLHFKKFNILVSHIPAQVNVEINTNGIQINSQSVTFWPILINFKENILPEPVLIACYQGAGKPDNCNNFLSEFVTEFKLLKNQGIN